jgi:proline iminopeptidase
MRPPVLAALLVPTALGALAVEAAAQEPDPSEQWYFWTDDDVRHYAFETGTARGAGDTIVVLHGGWGAEHSYLVRPLAGVASDYRLVFYDQRGSLRSPAPDSTIRIERMVEDLEHLRQSLGLERMTLLAHSMGGALAYAYLSRYPGRVRGIVLAGGVHPVAFSNDPPEEFLAEVWPDADVEALRTTREEFFEGWPERAAEVMERDGVIPEHLQHLPAQSPELWAELTDRERTRQWRINFTAVNACDPSGWREMEGGMAFYEQNVPSQLMSSGADYEEWTGRFWPALRAFPGPVRVIMGSCDYVDLGPDIWPRIVEHLPDAELHRVEGAGHAIWMDRPDAFEAEVRRALEAVREAEAGIEGR